MHQIEVSSSSSAVHIVCVTPVSWGFHLTPLPSALQALKAAGVTEVILAINYRPEVRCCAAERGDPGPNG